MVHIQQWDMNKIQTYRLLIVVFSKVVTEGLYRESTDGSVTTPTDTTSANRTFE